MTLTWTTDLLGDISLVNSATIDSYYNKGDKGGKDFLPAYPHNYFQLSAPLFLRNSTICIFYWGYINSSSSHGKINAYVKGKDGWELFTKLSPRTDDPPAFALLSRTRSSGGRTSMLGKG